MSKQAPTSKQPSMSQPDSAWQALADISSGPSEAEDDAERAAALERLALEHARCDDAASACYYLCRSLGAARQMEPSEPGLELLFELLGALADLPLGTVEPPPEPAVQGEADGLGVYELCQQLQAAREQSHQAWRELAEGDADDGTPLRIH